MMEPYRQADPRWSAEKLGESSTTTMGRGGCLVTSIAEVHRHFGGKMPPVEVNNILADHGRFVSGRGLLNTAEVDGATDRLLFSLGAPTAVEVDSIYRVKIIRTALDVAMVSGVAILRVLHGDNRTHFVSCLRGPGSDKASPRWHCADPAAGAVVLRSDMTISAHWGGPLPKIYRVVDVRACRKI